ncbi:MAG: hypothetical protein ISN28_14205 [Ectothiorhodospiraceae bacterium AqS1]|nr:hypothetical protein [Ectothiorhodospiraceae bacterium AqS1]
MNIPKVEEFDKDGPKFPHHGVYVSTPKPQGRQDSLGMRRYACARCIGAFSGLVDRWVMGFSRPKAAEVSPVIAPAKGL